MLTARWLPRVFSINEHRSTGANPVVAWLGRLGLILAILFGFEEVAFAQSEVPLWLEGPPTKNGFEDKEERGGNCVNFVSEATLTFYPAAPDSRRDGEKGKKGGPAVLVIPGGGYGGVCLGTEGGSFAPFLAKRGIVTAVLKYRLPNHHHEVPRDDVLHALRTVRHFADDYGIDKDKVGVWGFSAGGHLAATAANFGGPAEPDSDDAIKHDSAEVDFAILFYPVISMDPAITHGGSRRNLLGPEPAEALVETYSLDRQVDADHPPTFILHAADDRAVPVANALRYTEALTTAKVPVDLHVFTNGGHGPRAFKENPSWEASLDDWFARTVLKP